MDKIALRILLGTLAGLTELGGLVCAIIIVIDAFRDEVWKGFACFLCCFYGFYYALVEFENEHKWLIVAGACAGHGVALTLFSLIR